LTSFAENHVFAGQVYVSRDVQNAHASIRTLFATHRHTFDFDVARASNTRVRHRSWMMAHAAPLRAASRARALRVRYRTCACCGDCYLTRVSAW